MPTGGNSPRFSVLPRKICGSSTPTVGGCFGDKVSLSAGYYAGALAAVVTGRPARAVYFRRESFLATRKRHPFTIDYTLGATRRESSWQRKMDLLADGGAYVAFQPHGHGEGPDRCCPGPTISPTLR